MSTEELLRACGQLSQRGWVANHDGNISIRLPGHRFLVTPTAFRKGDIGSIDLLMVDLQGTVLSGRHRIFSEWQLHRAVYEARPDVRAVVHAHPPSSCAFAVSSRPLAIDFMPEALVSLGRRLAHVPYHRPGADELGPAVQQAAREANAALLMGHGPLTWGHDLTMAMARMELVEQLAAIHLKAQALGGPQSLEETEIQAMVAKHRKAGLAAPEAVS